MARAIWKGSISFGLVNIPIALYPATRQEEFIIFTYDHDKTQAARALTAKNKTPRIFFVIDGGGLGFQDWFNAQTFVIEPVGFVLDYVLMIGRCNLPRNVVGRAFGALRELTITAVF